MRNAKLFAAVFAALLAPSAASANGFVVSTGDGTLVRNSFGLTVTHVTTGQYEVDSVSPVHSCAYSVTPGSGSAKFELPAIATAVGRRENAQAVMIATYDANGNYADAGFHLIIQCTNSSPNGAAAVDADGTLARGILATAASHTGTGAYTVTFSNSAASSTCAYTAAVGLSTTSGTSDPGFVNVAAVSAGTIAVRTYDTNGNLADRGFHVQAMCNL
jgi:hypothetical protein